MTSDETIGLHRPRAVVWLGLWGLLIALYLGLAGSVGQPEVVAGISAATVAVVAMNAVRTRIARRFDPRLAWAGKLGRVAAQSLKDCAVVLGAIARALVTRRPIRGVFLTVPFDPGGEDGRSEARRALVLAAASVAPNTIAVAIEPEAGRLLVHQLIPSRKPPGGDREWPL